MKLRFGLRSLLWWTLLVGVSLGWWADHRRLAGSLSPSIRMHVKDSLELSTSWPNFRLACSNPPVCDVNFISKKHVQLVGRQPGQVVIELWEQGAPEPCRFLVVVSP